MNAANPHILFIRLSSLGDVALCVPVIKNFRLQHPNVKISILSKSFHAPLFDAIENITFIPFDTHIHKGIGGLISFVLKELFSKDYTHIIDLHDVLRSKVIRFLYRFKKVKIVCFDKGRTEKEQSIHTKSIQQTALIHITERYANAIRLAGFSCELSDRDNSFMHPKKENYIVGIAPLSKHFTKNVPIDKLIEVIQKILEDSRIQIKILCASNEQEQLKSLIIDKRVQFLMNTFDFKKELELIKQLDVVISMDSANMHIASNYQVPVITLWGGTHPNMGFASYYTKNINIQTDLACRPCSVYGRGDCPLGHFNCMKQVPVENILSAINKILL